MHDVETGEATTASGMNTERAYLAITSRRFCGRAMAIGLKKYNNNKKRKKQVLDQKLSNTVKAWLSGWQKKKKKKKVFCPTQKLEFGVCSPTIVRVINAICGCKASNTRIWGLYNRTLCSDSPARAATRRQYSGSESTAPSVRPRCAALMHR